jgi:hypothetical protein
MKKIFLLPVLMAVLTACQESLEQRAERTMRDYSEKNCPLKLSESIVMDSCSFEADTHTLHYFYHFSGALDNDSSLNKEGMRQILVDALKNETSTRIYKEAGYNFMYTYFSEKRPDQILFEATMTQEDYGQ